MVTSSAPGTLFLFGEHAVVYGEPAVACAIKRRTTVTVERRSDSQISIDAPQLMFDGVRIRFDEGPPSVDVPAERIEEAARYVKIALDKARAVADEPEAGFDVQIESELPMSSGLGSSAAVTVATLDAAVRACGTSIDRSTLAEQAYQVEYEAQDGGASRTQTFGSTMGGAIRVTGDEHEPIGTPELPFVIGYDGGGGDTGELVAMVRNRKDIYPFVQQTVDAIGSLTRQGDEVIRAGAMGELGQLMNINHGLLAALGVSTQALDTMAWAARDAGADGAKLTGAGGGGCVVALDETSATETALEMTPASELVFRAELAPTGVQRE